MKSKIGRFADTHCHLSLPAFSDDLPMVLQRAQEANVFNVLVPGVDLRSSREAVRLAEQHQQAYAAVGIHPHYSADLKPSHLRELRHLAESERVVAVGETGLDFYRMLAPREDQVLAFQSQLDLAGDLDLPVVVHNREATSDVLEMLLSWSQQLNDEHRRRAGVLHAFSADLGSANKLAAAGFYFGLAGSITYRSNRQAGALARNLPLERLLVETDAPYLTPEPHRGSRNEPAYVTLVTERLSELLRDEIAGTAEVTSRNAARLFGWDNGNDYC